MKAFSFLSQFSYWIRVILVGAVLGFGLQFAQAWVGPTATPPNGNIGLKKYVSDCASFAVNGWANKDECLQDGRWHKVLSHSVTGAVANADLTAAINAAADIRVSAPGFNNAYWACSNVLMDGGYAVCDPASGYSGEVSDRGLNAQSVGSNKTIGAAVLKSNGLVGCVQFGEGTYNLTTLNRGGCGYNFHMAMNWYVRY